MVGSLWLGKRARIIVEEVTDAKPKQPDPPAEMTAEQAMEWLRGGASRVVLDKQGDVWQWGEGDFWVSGDDGPHLHLSTSYAPYVPLAPVTRGQMARVEELEFEEKRLNKLVEFERLSTAAWQKKAEDLERALDEAAKLLREATKP